MLYHGVIEHAMVQLKNVKDLEVQFDTDNVQM